MADRLRRDITRNRPDLRWRDFWGSHDPAPAGHLQLEQIQPSIADPSRVRSFRVWNRRSLLDDHGGYFDNDEEFVLPVLREIDVPDGWGESSRFYPPDPPDPPPASSPADGPALSAGAHDGQDSTSAPSPVDDADEDPRGLADPRVTRHRQRVAVIALWRQAGLAIPVATIALALQLFPDRLVRIGTEIAALVPRVPVLADLADLFRTFSTTTLPSLAFELPFVGVIGPGAIADVTTSLGLGVLQAVVLISALQLVAAPIQAFLAWPRDALARPLIWAVETIVIAEMVVAVVVPLLLVGDHGRLLGAGVVAWIPGIVVTVGTGVLAWLGTVIARVIHAPAASSAFGAIASVVFVVALAASLVAIFRVPDLERVELAYVAVWIGAYAVLTIGNGRWAVWDNAERQIAYGTIANVPVDRTPVLAAASGFLLVAVDLAAWVLLGSSGWIVAGMVVAVGLIVLAMALGARAWRRYGDPTSAPTSVESARGSV